MGAPIMNPSYVDENFIAEAEQVAGSMEFSEGARKLGFTDPTDREQLARFLAHLSPTGERLMRWQANSPEWLYCPIPTVTPPVNAWLKSLPLEGFSKFMAEVMKPAVELYFKTIESRCFVRDTVDGIKRSTKAELIGLIALNAFARDGNSSAHGHPMFWRFGVTDDGGVKSFADRRFVPRMMGIANEIFQLEIAVGIHNTFGIETRITSGKCEVVGVSKEALDSVGTRRKEMFEYLKAKGIEPTPEAMAYAAINTRPEKKAYTLSERLNTWNREVANAQTTNGTTTDPSPWASRLKAMIDEFIVQPAKLVGLAYRYTWGKHPGNVRVHDLGIFLEDTRPRTRLEGHKAAVRALMRTNLQGLTHALNVAQKAYKRGRQPLRKLPKGVRVVLSKKAALEATPKQLEELRTRAIKEGWVLRIDGQTLTGGMSMSQTPQGS